MESMIIDTGEFIYQYIAIDTKELDGFKRS